LEGEIRQQIRENGLTGIITLKKPVQYREIPDVYASHDCLVLASRNEAIGMVVPEALACGIPCIVPDTGGPSTYITHGRNGLVFRTGDPASLGAALQRMLEEREYRRMQEEAARGRERLLWRSVVTGLLGMMEEKG
jgi:glycosyltransferase involved in cell wall biosynthesis